MHFCKAKAVVHPSPVPLLNKSLSLQSSLLWLVSCLGLCPFSCVSVNRGSRFQHLPWVEAFTDDIFPVAGSAEIGGWVVACQLHPSIMRFHTSLSLNEFLSYY